MSLTRELLVNIEATAQLLGVATTDAMVKIFAAQLAQYPEPVVHAALERCQREITYRPANLLAAIIERIEETRTDGWPTANEAWAAVGKADEGKTLVCVAQAFEALADVAGLLGSDEVGARMAFLESYKRKVAAAKAAGIRPRWSVQFGHDKAGREVALRGAVQAGRLPEQDARRLLGYVVPGLALPARPRLHLVGSAVPERAKADDLRKGNVGKVLDALADPALAQAALEERRKNSQKVYRVVDGRPQLVPGVEVPLPEIVTGPARFVPPDREAVAALRARR